MSNTAKINSREIFGFARPGKLIPAKMQTFRGFLKPRNFLPAKMSSIKVGEVEAYAYLLKFLFLRFRSSVRQSTLFS